MGGGQEESREVDGMGEGREVEVQGSTGSSLWLQARYCLRKKVTVSTSRYMEMPLLSTVSYCPLRADSHTLGKQLKTNPFQLMVARYMQTKPCFFIIACAQHSCMVY